MNPDTALPDAKRPPVNAAEAALELMKQLISLSAGALALSATFIGQLNGAGRIVLVLFLSWLSLIVAMVAGLKTVSAIVKSGLKPEQDWSTGIGQTAGRVSNVAFVIGLVLLATFAGASVGARRDPSLRSNTFVQSLPDSCACQAPHKAPCVDSSGVARHK